MRASERRVEQCTFTWVGKQGRVGQCPHSEPCGRQPARSSYSWRSGHAMVRVPRGSAGGGAPTDAGRSSAAATLRGADVLAPGSGSGSAPAPLTNCPTDCNGHGVCYNATCRCVPPFGGDTCGEAKPCAEEKCSGHGVCTDGQCMCLDGWSGPICSLEVPKEEEPQCLNRCAGHGACVNQACACQPGWGGPDCSEKNKCPKNCGGKGICREGTCICVQGQGGEDCTASVEPQPCPNFCSGRGFCMEGGRCRCDPGWGGFACESEVPLSACEADCNHRGACLKGAHGHHYCACAHEFDGATCDRNLECPFDCSHHGICQEGQCLCASGWGDFDCSKPVRKLHTRCPRDCSGRGVCTKEHKCQCAPGYAGPDCKSKAPCPRDCSKRGACIDGVCHCAPGFKGKDCSVNELGIVRDDPAAQIAMLKDQIAEAKVEAADAKRKAAEMKRSASMEAGAPEGGAVKEEVTPEEEAKKRAADAPAERGSPFADRGGPDPAVSPSRPIRTAV